jgi:hypothetical protein
MPLSSRLKELGGVFKPVPPSPNVNIRTPRNFRANKETSASELKGAVMPDVK